MQEPGRGVEGAGAEGGERGMGGKGVRPSGHRPPHRGVWRQNPGVPAGTAPLRSQRFAKNTVTPSFSPRGNF